VPTDTLLKRLFQGLLRVPGSPELINALLVPFWCQWCACLALWVCFVITPQCLNLGFENLAFCDPLGAVPKCGVLGV
jgi:hypothetical protein